MPEYRWQALNAEQMRTIPRCLCCGAAIPPKMLFVWWAGLHEDWCWWQPRPLPDESHA